MLNILIPCYNEEEKIQGTIGQIEKWAKDKKIEYLILAINNASTDKTLEILNLINNKNLIVINEPKKGKGNAVKTGLKNLTSNKVLIIDADLSTHISQFNLSWLDLEDTLLIGSRRLGSEPLTPMRRKIPGYILNFIIQSLFSIELLDTQCGFKYLSYQGIKNIASELSIGGFMYDLDLIILCKRNNVEVTEHPVDYYFSPDSSVSIVKDSFKMLGDVYKLYKINN